MKTLILYYSRSGNTRKAALRLAGELSADIEEIFDVKKPFVVTGAFRAIRRKKTPIKPLKARLDGYEKIIIMSPIWASHPVSAINSVIDLLPKDREVEFVMVSKSGNSEETKAGTIKLAEQKGCRVTKYSDVKS